MTTELIAREPIGRPFTEKEIITDLEIPVILPELERLLARYDSRKELRQDFESVLHTNQKLRNVYDGFQWSS